jgi:hypothetical protein
MHQPASTRHPIQPHRDLIIESESVLPRALKLRVRENGKNVTHCTRLNLVSCFFITSKSKLPLSFCLILFCY